MKLTVKSNPKKDRYTYRVTWSQEDGEYVGLCAEFPSLSWLAGTPEDALAGIRKVVRAAVRDIEASGAEAPFPLAVRNFSGEFRVRIPPEVHRSLALHAAEQGVSLNRLISSKLSS
ncbi:MAG: type II toxin-antitoxin system HicB family antitoxin [Terracidiphilus sp.]